MIILLGVLAVLFLIGFASAIHALYHVPVSEERIAWVLALALVPFIALLPYWLLGRGRFDTYVQALRESEDALEKRHRELDQALTPFVVEPDWLAAPLMSHLAGELDFTRGNIVKLMPDGLEAFSTLFQAIEQASERILVQFFIFRDDALGRSLANRLCDAADRGVEVYVIYDGFGSLGRMSTRLKDRLCDKGIEVRPFMTSRRPMSRFQLNFINHRKLVVIDGKCAFMGGFNIGNEYLGRDPDFGPWRDTMVQFRGPAALQAQFSFLTDWQWCADEVLDLCIPDQVVAEQLDEDNDATALVLPSGPHDPWPSTQLMFVELIQRAERRLWLSTPYFVPDAAVGAALRCAALRGVDVRIVVAGCTDSTLADLSGILHRHRFRETPVRFFVYERAFIHQKAVLIDDDTAVVGSANTDARSILLQFENSLLIRHRGTAAELERIMLQDQAVAHEAAHDELDTMGPVQRLGIYAASLFSPVL